MFVLVLSGLLIIVFMVLLPIVIGSDFCWLINTNPSLSISYSVGFLLMMATCELIAVPFVFFKMSFISFIAVYSLVVLLFLLFLGGRTKNNLVSLYKDTKNKIKSYGVIEYICLFLMFIVITVIIINSVRLYVVDEDDSRFVVTAADIVRTNTLLLADPNTGIVYDTWTYGMDAAKDVVAPHAVFCAMLSKATLTNVNLFMHNVYPVILYLLSVCIYMELISELIEGNESLRNDKHIDAYKYLFVFIILVFTIFQYSTRSTRETMYLVRLWQGKAILSAIIIPFLFFLFYRAYRKSDKSSFVLLFITSLAGCLTSSMATLLIPFMIAIYGLVYGIVKKSIRMTLNILISAIIPILLAFLSVYIKNEMVLWY